MLSGYCLAPCVGGGGWGCRWGVIVWHPVLGVGGYCLAPCVGGGVIVWRPVLGVGGGWGLLFGTLYLPTKLLLSFNYNRLIISLLPKARV